MNSMSKAALLFFLFISVFQAQKLQGEEVPIEGFSPNQKWVEMNSENGLTVYKTDIPNSNLLGFKLKGTVDANIRDLMTNIRDVERSVEWTPELLKKITIENLSDIEALTYSVNNLPWPISDRDFILHNKLYLSKKKKLLFVISKSVEHKDYPHKKDLVRAWIHYSNMGLRPLGEKKTFVEWTLFVDPKGNIPAWLVNFYQSGFPIKFFTMAKERANEVKLPMLPRMESMLKELKLIMGQEANNSKYLTRSTPL